MIQIIDIAFKDVLEIVRDRKTFLFLLVMPIAFTILFGFAFGGFDSNKVDPRLSVGIIDQDYSDLSTAMKSMLESSEVIRLVKNPEWGIADLEQQVAGNELSAGMIIPIGFGEAMRAGEGTPIIVIADPSQVSGTTVVGEIMASVSRIFRITRTADLVQRATGFGDTSRLIQQSLVAWKKPPVRVEVITSSQIKISESGPQSMAHSSIGMMLQFAIAGLLTSGQVIVNERKCRALQRLMTTATRRPYILLGHYLAIFILITCQFILLIGFGQLFLKVDYLRNLPATLFMSIATVICIAALGLLIGVMSKSDEQAIVFSILTMFLLAGLGGAWTPLEFTSPGFQAVGHISPVAWAMDGFKNITARGLGFDSVVAPAASLLGYAGIFLLLAVWRFQVAQEKPT